MKIEQRPWKPQDLLDDLQSIIDEEPDSYMNSRRVTLCMARDYLKEYFSQMSNDPLTLEELREMDGEPVWVVPLSESEYVKPEYALVSAANEWLCTSNTDYWEFDVYGRGVIAYLSKPEEGTE